MFSVVFEQDIRRGSAIEEVHSAATGIFRRATDIWRKSVINDKRNPNNV